MSNSVKIKTTDYNKFYKERYADFIESEEEFVYLHLPTNQVGLLSMELSLNELGISYTLDEKEPTVDIKPRRSTQCKS